jgi:orotate phosphoribosyltransferase
MPYKTSTNKGVFDPRNWSERLEKNLPSGGVSEVYFENENYSKYTKSPEQIGQAVLDDIEEIINYVQYTT